jgi:hypothetical protein
MGSKKVALVLFFFLFGCVGGPGYIESLYGGQSLPSPIKTCISSSGDSDPVFFDCVVNAAQISSDSSLCKQAFSLSKGTQMEPKRDSCIFQVESEKGDSAFCSELSQDGFREYCDAIMGLSSDGCVSLSEESSSCYLQTELFSFEGVSVLAFRCLPLTRSDCLTRVAAQARNPAICEKIDEVCDLNFSLSCRLSFDECYTKIGEKTGNTALCRNLGFPFQGVDISTYSPEKSMNDCVLRVFNSTDKLSECSKLTGRQKGECISEYAVATKDPLNCEKIGSELKGVVKLPVRQVDYSGPNSDWSVYAVSETRDQCFTNLAVNQKDPSICGREFFVVNGQSACLFEVAISTGNRTLCASISSEDIKKSCLSQLGKS